MAVAGRVRLSTARAIGPRRNRVSPPASRSRPSSCSVAASGVVGRAGNSRGPNNATSAGTSVSDTASVTSVVAARPGPKARKKSSRPTVRAAVPAATMSPAVRTIGVTSATAPRAAAIRLSPAYRRRRVSERKKIE